MQTTHHNESSKVKDNSVWHYLFESYANSTSVSVRIVSLWAIFVIVFFASHHACAGDLRFEHVMTENGISVAETNAVTQDQQGFIWVGGSNGLARYNGQEFKLFLHDPKNIHSLSSNYVWDILVDSQGQLWVATTGGLNRFNAQTEQFDRFLKSSANPASIISNDVYTLYEDVSGRLWVGTRHGLDLLDQETRGFRHFRHATDKQGSISNSSITAIYQDSKEQLWVGTQTGLNKFSESGQSFSLFQFDGIGGLYDPLTSIRDIVEDNKNNLWVGTDNGLYRFNQITGEAEHYVNQIGNSFSLSDNRTWKLMVDDSDRLWVTTDHGGLNRFDSELNQFDRFHHDPLRESSLGSDQVREIYQDHSGDYWVALFPSGVDYMNHAASVFNIYKKDASGSRTALGSDVIASIAKGPNGKSWVGTEDGLYLFDPTNKKFEAFKHNSRDQSSIGEGAVLAITEDTLGQYWFGTWSGGLNHYDSISGEFKQFMPDAGDANSISSAYVWSVLGDSRGDIWVGTESGSLDRYTPKTNTFTHFVPSPHDPKKLSGGFIRSIVEDSEGVVWIATINGLNRFNADSLTFTRYQNSPGDDTSIPHNNVAIIFQDSHEQLWVGTEGGGLARMDRETGMFTSYDVNNGLSNNSVLGISEDSRGFLWLNTLHGLNRFDPLTESASVFTEVNGLAGSIMNRSAIHYDRNGFVMVGSTKGLTRFDPQSISSNKLIPPVVLTSFKIFNQEVEIGNSSPLDKHVQFMDEVVLDYQNTMFYFGFAALNFRNPEANQYDYFLDGFDRQWIPTQHGKGATYTNLSPGRYTFKVRGSNNNGVWNEKGHEIDVVILPPPWRTWWAYLIYVCMLLGIAYGFVCIQRRKIDFEKQKVTQLREIDKVKDEFLANTSHELRTPLNGIIGLTESMVDDPNAVMSDQVRSYLRMVSASGRRLSNLINDILDFSKIKNNGLEVQLVPVDLKSVCDTVCFMIRPLAEKKSLKLVNEVEEGLPSVTADEDRLQQVLYNLIGNAIKFTLEGEVRLHTQVNGEEVTVFIEDTGVGIRESDLNSIFDSFTQGCGEADREFEGTGLGLAVAKNIIELHGGTVNVESVVGYGSTFSFTLNASDQKAGVKKVENTENLVNRIHSITEGIDESEGGLHVTKSPNREQYKFHILIVDDDVINREVLMSQLSLHEYRISQAVNGQEAVEAVKHDDSIDMVLLDVMMPRMTGYEAAEQIRAIKPVHELPIIFITAKHLASDLVAGFVAGGNDFLIKPISKHELLSRTKTHLLLLDVTRNLENIVEERTDILKKTQHSLEVIDSIVHLINKEDSLEGLAKILLKESSELLGNVDMGALWFSNDAEKSFNLIAAHGSKELFDLFPKKVSSRYLGFDDSRSFIQKGVQIVSPSTVRFVPKLDQHIENILVMAIEADNELTGLLILANKKGDVAFSDEDKAILARIETHAVSAVSKAKMLTVLKEQNLKLERISYTDQLTKLNNRRHLVRYLQGDLALCARRYQVANERDLGDAARYPNESDLLFIMVDIDYFKPVNDTYGHNAGDSVLKDFADILRSVFRESDHLIRWGGEEFLVVLRFFDREAALTLVERFRKKVESTEFDIGNDVVLKKTCSIGYSFYPFYQNQPDAFSWEQVVEVADKCLYIAKESHRNAWVGVCGNPDSASVLEFDGVMSHFKQHVENKQLLLRSSIPEPSKIQL